MKIFLDTANVAQIREAVRWSVLEQLVRHPLTDIGIEKFLADARTIPPATA